MHNKGMTALAVVMGFALMASAGEAAPRGKRARSARPAATAPKAAELNYGRWNLDEAALNTLDYQEIAKRAALPMRDAEMLAAAENGDPIAQYLAGNYYDTAPHIDLARSAAFYEKSAARLPRGKRALATSYLAGKGVPVDQAKAVTLLQEAAAAGAMIAYADLAQIYANRGDAAAAFTAASRAADGGVPAAQLLLARMYARGVGTPANPAKAKTLLEIAAANGNAPALAEIGSLYINGTGVPVDKPFGWGFVKRGAEAGDVRAQALMGDALTNGLKEGAIKRDGKAAINWYQVAAAQGDAHSRITLAVLALDGTGVKKDTMGAMQQLRGFGDAGNLEAQLILARRYRDYKEWQSAIVWSNKAAAQGNAEARQIASYSQAKLDKANEKAAGGGGGGLLGGMLAAVAGGGAMAALGGDSNAIMNAAAQIGGMANANVGSAISQANAQMASNPINGGTGGGASMGGNDLGSGPKAEHRTNYLEGSATCPGMTNSNYRDPSVYQMGNDTQLGTMCAQAFEYFHMYENAVDQGYSQTKADQTWNAYQTAARNAQSFYQNNKSAPGSGFNRR